MVNDEYAIFFCLVQNLRLMKDILSEIIANKRFEVDLQKQAISIEQLQEGVNEVPAVRSMKQALASSDSGIIAEFKRRSPSKGWIKQEARPEEIVPSYLAAGASALSILTDEKFFGGSLKDIRTARPLVDVPIIRKDFIIDEYQLYRQKLDRVRMPYFLSRPHWNRKNVRNWQNRHMNWDWKYYLKSTVRKSYLILIAKLYDWD